MTVTMTQALRQLEQLQGLVDEREARTIGPMTDVELARAVSFAINQAAYGNATPKQVRQAKQLHFMLFGTPEIDLTKFGPQDRKPIVCIDGGKPNQLTSPEAQPLRFGYWGAPNQDRE